LDIGFANTRIKKICNDNTKAQKKYGDINAKRLRQRLDDLHAAQILADFSSLPGRCHELTGDRAGQLSLDLDHPMRLIFEPAHNPVPRKEDGGIDWTQVTAVKILDIEDTHG